MQTKHLIGAALAAGLALPASAQAHVTLQPAEASAGAFTVENVRVPNEHDDTVTTKVDVKLPHGFVQAAYEALPGWRVAVQKAKLATPVTTDDGEVTEEVSRITWTADSKQDGIQPGQFRDFPLSVQIPDTPGRALTFKALQTYSDGEVVRWIGAPDSDAPAPQVRVVAADSSGAHGAHPVAAATADPGDKASKGLAVAALIVGALGVLLGGAGLMRRRA